jgi:hypothetical protein
MALKFQLTMLTYAKQPYKSANFLAASVGYSTSTGTRYLTFIPAWGKKTEGEFFIPTG